MTRLPEAELAFLCDLLKQLDDDARERFEARLAAFLLAHPDCGSGALGREVRAAFKASGWIPPPDNLGLLEAALGAPGRLHQQARADRIDRRLARMPCEHHVTLVKQDIEALG